VGQWQDSRRAEFSLMALATLVGQTAVTLTPEGALSIPSLKAADGKPHQWDEIAPFLWQSRTGHERLAAKVADGRVIRWSIDSLSPTAVFDRVPAARSANWLLPALGTSLSVLLLTVLQGPAARLVRRWRRAPVVPTGRAPHAVGIASLLALAILGGWMAMFAAMLSNVTLIGADGDPWLRLLRISGAIVFLAAPITAGTFGRQGASSCAGRADCGASAPFLRAR